MTRFKKIAGKALATIGVAGLAVAGAAGAAFAAQGTDGTPPGNAAEDTTGTLVIHKYAGTTTDQTNNGTELPSVDRTPLGGVTFTICQVDGVDLSTNAGWTAIASLDVNTATCSASWAQRSAVTDAQGLATFANLPIGLYKVVESGVPAGVTALTEAFLVSIPYPSANPEGQSADTNWLWKVHVYPKNTLEGDGEKTVADPGTHGLGSNVEWTIKTRPLGSFNDGALTSYKIIDKPVTDLNYVNPPASTLQYKTPSGTLTDVPAAYYTILPAASDGAAHTAQITVEFNADGLAWINGSVEGTDPLPAGTYFEWKLTTKVVGVGELKNEVYENVGDEDVKVGEATTDWGAARLLKHEVNKENKGLAGAEFTVHDALIVDGEATCEGTLGAALTVNGQSVFTSTSTGEVDIPGLYVGKNGEPASRAYCVVETKAPHGYTASNDPMLITVTPGSVAQGTYNVKVPNTPVEGPELPLTGANGTLLMTIGGLGLMAVAGGAYMVTRRKASHQ